MPLPEPSALSPAAVVTVFTLLILAEIGASGWLLCRAHQRAPEPLAASPPQP